MVLTQRHWLLSGAGVGIILVVLTYFGGVGPALSHNSSVRTQTSAIQDSNDLLAIKNNGLRAQAAKMDALATQLSQQRVALPATDNIAGFSREINQLATSDGVGITSFAAATPTQFLTTGAAPSTITGSPVGKLFQIPVSLVTAAPMANQLAFIKDLQASDSRAVLVGNVSLSLTTGPTVDATISLKIFLAPQNPATEAILQKALGAGK